MSYKIIPSTNFIKEATRLHKKYPSLKEDLRKFWIEIKKTPLIGESLGKDCYKVQVAIASKVKGKREGARVITCVKIIKQHIHILTIYDKSEKDNISDKEIQDLLGQIDF